MMVENITCSLQPEELFARLRDHRGSFFLDSGLDVAGTGGWSFMGTNPFLTFSAKENRIVLDRDGEEEVQSGDAWGELKKLWQHYRTATSSVIPFSGGMVGFLSYEFGARFERVASRTAADSTVPEAQFGFYDGVIAYDHASRCYHAIANPAAGRSQSLILDGLKRLVAEAISSPVEKGSRPKNAAAVEPHASFAKPDYLTAIQRIKNYIAAGDVYQVNLTQRFETPLPVEPWQLYQRLRRRSPAPFASYLNFDGVEVVSSSPERFLRIDRDGRVETRPIKGTRPRGKTPAEDERLRHELPASEKDRAELLMIVDLERNDLGRVCVPGTVKVQELNRVEAHPTVFHLVATVSGQLRSDCDVFDCIRAAFPGGSITGAPKIRAMQIIDELEPCRRGIYTGAIGYVGFDGACDLNVAIRTIVCHAGKAAYHVGGGIVWDSDPESEYQETLDKGRAMRAALIESE